MIKKILAVAALAVTFGLSGEASAMDLGTAFSNLTGSSNMTSTQAAQVYTSAARTSVDLGGVQMRVPRSQLTLFSITPPSLSASCAGISAHFGGISFISGQEIQTMIQHIEQGIPGAVLQLAIKLLCPQCEAVLQAMEKLAQDAAKLAIDSCHVSDRIASYAETSGIMGNPATGNRTTNFCAQQQANSGSSTDPLMSELSSACSSTNSALNSISTWMNSTDASIGGGTPAQKAQEASKIGLYGNRTWDDLSNAGWCPTKLDSAGNGTPTCSPDDPATEGALHTKLMLMNLLGTSVIAAPGTATSSTSSTATTGSGTGTNPGTSGSTDGNLIYPPNVTVDDIYDMLMCGAPVTVDPNVAGTAGIGKTVYNTRSMTEVCGPFWSSKYITMQMYDCTNQDYVRCAQVTITPAANTTTPLFSGPGFIYQVTKLLTDAAVKVSTNQPWNWNDSENQQLAALVSAAPFPLYQAINAAAVYPAAAADLLDSMGLETAELMVYATIGDMLSPVARPAGQQQSTSAAAMQRMYAALGAIRTEVTEHQKVMGGQIALQEALSREIVQINQTIQRQVLSDDFLGNTRFATALAVQKPSGN
jgi:hypothetical protein